MEVKGNCLKLAIREETQGGGQGKNLAGTCAQDVLVGPGDDKPDMFSVITLQTRFRWLTRFGGSCAVLAATVRAA